MYYSGGVKVQGQTIWVSLFYDKFSSFGSRHDSLGGLYLVIGNQDIRFSSKYENVFLLQLVPKDCEFADVWESYRLELISLEKDGFDAFDPKYGEVKHYFGRLALFKADSPQRCELCRHKGARTNYVCPKCSTFKNDIWNLEDFRHLLYQPGYINAVAKLKAILKDKFGDVEGNFGFNGSPDLFTGLTFNAHRQCVVEVRNFFFFPKLFFDFASYFFMFLC